jgi:excisionase family DNA binding protein
MRLVDAKEVAEILQVNIQRVYELTRQGILPNIRIGPRQIRYEETRLTQWIEHSGRLNAEGLEAKLAAEEGLSESGADSSRGRNRSGTRRDEGSQGSTLRFDELREF